MDHRRFPPLLPGRDRLLHGRQHQPPFWKWAVAALTGRWTGGKCHPQALGATAAGRRAQD
jgi:hypothetical protein